MIEIHTFLSYFNRVMPSKIIYLDGHSTTALDPVVFEAMKPYFMERFGNASHGIHRYNWEAEAAVEKARFQIAQFIGAHERELIFTSGATESNHLAILGLAPALLEAKRTKILSIEIEHASLLGPLEQLKERGFEIEWVKITADGRVDLADLKSKLDEKVGLVSIAFANHEIGTIQPIREISQLVHSVGAILHTDAVQAFGKIRFDVNHEGIDLMTLSAHKIYGPKGTGALYVRRKNPHVELEPLFWGGSQERGLRAGTPNTPGIVGFGEAAVLANSLLETETARFAELRDLLWNEFQTRVPCLVRNGSTVHALPNNLNISLVGIDGAALFGRLKQVAVSNASACLNGTQDYSQVLTVLGVEKNLARASIRFGIGRWNTREDILAAVEEITEVALDLRQMEKEFAIQTGVEIKDECKNGDRKYDHTDR